MHYNLGQKFTGPFKVIKIQSNLITHEISNDEKIIKAHHDQLKLYKECPPYISEVLSSFHAGDASVKQSAEVSEGDSSDHYVCAVGNDLSSSESDTEVNRPIIPNASNLQRPRSKRKPNNKPKKIIRAPAEKVNTQKARIPPNRHNIVGCGPVVTQECESVPMNRSDVLDWSFDSDDFNTDIVELNRDDLRISSPIFTDTEIIPMNISDKFSSIGVNTESFNDKQSINDFLSWVEQSLAVQESILHEMNESHSLNRTHFHEDDGDSSTSSDLSSTRLSSYARNFLSSSAVDHLKYMKNCVRNFKESESHKSRSWLERHECDLTETEEEKEASDIIVELPLNDNLTSQRRVATRSQGPVEIHPWVQTKTIEFKQYKSAISKIPSNILIILVKLLTQCVY